MPLTPIPHPGEFAALATAFLWSGSSLVFAAASRRVGSILVNVSRLVFAFFYLALLLLLLGTGIQCTTHQMIYLGMSGIVGLAIGDSFLFRAYQLIGARVSMLIMSITPAISAILAFLVLGESLSVWGMLGMGITIGGIALVVVGRTGAESSLFAFAAGGIASASLAAVSQAVSLVFVKMAFADGTIDGFVATLLRISVALVVLLPVVSASRRLSHPLETFSRDRRALMLTAIGAVLGPFLGISFSLIAVANTSVGIAATLMGTVPIIMLPLLRIIYKEALSAKALAGAFIAVAGVAILFLR